MKLKELSRLLNLSATTVSRALNGYPEVNAETRARVQAAARRHGYAPNQMARRLATGRSMAIGHVVPLAAHQIINPLFAEFIHGAGEAYSAAGYDMIVSVVPEAREADAYEAMARRRKVDGVIVHGPLRLDPRIDLLEALGMPFLTHGRDDERPDDAYPWMDIDNRRAFRRATDHLLDFGHRRLALLNGLEAESFAWRRRRGYVEALEARGGSELAALRAQPDVAISPLLRPGADPDTVRRCLAEDFDILMTRRANRRELAEIAEELQGIPGERLTYRLGQTAAALDRAGRSGFGDSTADLGEDRESLSNHLQTLIDSQIWVKKKRRPPPE